MLEEKWVEKKKKKMLQKMTPYKLLHFNIVLNLNLLEIVHFIDYRLTLIGAWGGLYKWFNLNISLKYIHIYTSLILNSVLRKKLKKKK
jgi:hypothetical protein